MICLVDEALDVAVNGLVLSELLLDESEGLVDEAPLELELLDALLSRGVSGAEVIGGAPSQLFADVRRERDELIGGHRGVLAHDAAVLQRTMADATAAGSDVSTSDEAKSEPRPPRPPAAAPPVRASQRDRDAKVLNTILNANAPLSKQQLAERTGLNADQLAAPLKRLIEAGKVRAEGATKARRYQAGEHEWHSQKRAEVEEGLDRNARKVDDAVRRVGLRDRVMKAVAADPCALDNNRLALALDADVDDIADACQFLIDGGRLQMHEDGTYLRSIAEAAREIAAA